MEDGTVVAVKVQYPGIAATIDTDLWLLRSALGRVGTAHVPMPDPAIVERVLGEIERQLHEEVDYLHEAAQQSQFRAYAQHPDIVIANIVESRTTRTVLTQELLPGLHLKEWLASQPSQTLRDRQGQIVFDWFMQCAFTRRRLHADLHPGNFVFLPDGRVGVLDFGCTRALSRPFTSGLARAWCAWLEQPSPSDTLLEIYRGMGLVDTALERSTFETNVLPGIAPFLDWASEPFTQAHFDFAHKRPAPTFDAGTHAALMRHTADMPTEMPSFDRAWLGLMHLLRRLGSVVDTQAAHELLRSVKY